MFPPTCIDGERAPKAPPLTQPAYNGTWPKFRLAVLNRDGWQCQLQLPGCKGRANTVDHIIGLAQGGARLDPNNCVAACSSCNIAKGNRDNPRTPRWRRRNHLPSRKW